MRVNHPVSGREYPFPSGQTLVSTTDAQGRILYCNEAFVAVSGYTEAELQGQPHNIVRHPDMPEEAFRDMWATISSGRPWSAAVKNRRKDGDHYWVWANATPLLDHGRVTGYMSVRTEATRAQIQEAEAIYATMRREKQEGRRVTILDQGFVAKNTLFGRVSAGIKQMRLSTKLFLVSLVNIGLASALGVWLGSLGLAWVHVGITALLIILAWQLKVRLVAVPLNRLIGSANTIAGGDLTVRVARERYDEVGDLQAALGQLSVNLQSIVRDARDQATALVTGASEISQGNLDLSQRTEAQASNLEETAASMEEITATVSHSAHNATAAGDLAMDVLGSAERSNAAVGEVNDTMQLIHESSRRIEEITSVLDGLAFQTNLLALNAAVEAARAGDTGRGFAVVAGEVRALSKRSAESAKEIKQLIQESTARINEGLSKTSHASKTMADAVEGVRKVSHLVADIGHGAREQLSGISQINAAVSHLDTITQQNAALVEEVASAAHALEGVAHRSRSTMDVFRLGGEASYRPDAVALRRTAKGY